MAFANSSIAVTPSGSANVATQTANSKEHQVIMLADAYGHIIGARDLYWFSAVAMAKAANKNLLSIFNADAALIVELVYAQINQELTAAVTGLVRGYRLSRTTSTAHSAGTSLTAGLFRTAGTALDADITGRANGQTVTASGDPFGVAGVGEEETGAGGAAPHILYSEAVMGEPLILTQNQGAVIFQDATAGTGVISALMAFRVR